MKGPDAEASIFLEWRREFKKTSELNKDGRPFPHRYSEHTTFLSIIELVSDEVCEFLIYHLDTFEKLDGG